MFERRITLNEARARFGAMIRHARLGHGWSQRDLEAMSGVDQTVISRLENGKMRGLQLDRVAALVAALDGYISLGLPVPDPPEHRRRLPGQPAPPSAPAATSPPPSYATDGIRPAEAVWGAEEPVRSAAEPVGRGEEPVESVEEPVGRAEEPVGGAEAPVAGEDDRGPATFVCEEWHREMGGLAGGQA